MTADKLSTLRFMVFLIAGLIIASYGVLALWLSRPDPMWAGVPTLAGLGAVAIIWISAARSGTKVAGATFDELYDAEWSRALGWSYWFAIGLYPLVSVFLIFGMIDHAVAFAAMGTLTGSAPLLLFCLISARS